MEGGRTGTCRGRVAGAGVLGENPLAILLLTLPGSLEVQHVGRPTEGSWGMLGSRVH